MTPKPVVETRGASVSFDGVPALTGVDLTLYAGEVHSLMGENGAGKSTLVKALTGVHPLEGGEILIDGEPRRVRGLAGAHGAGVAAVYQEIGLCPNLTVAENIMIGSEVRGVLGIDWRRTYRAAERTLAELGLQDLRARLPLSALTPGATRLVAVARAMAAGPRVLILDEPTAGLAESEVTRLFEVVRRLRASGVAILFVSHSLEEVYAISDRVTVLRGGVAVGEYRTDELDRAELISKVFGKNIEGLQAIGSQRRLHRPEPTTDPLYRVVGLGRRGVMEATNLDLFPGEIVGLAGLRGSGRSELASLLGAAEPRDSGDAWVDGTRAVLPSPRSALRRRVVLLADDRDGDAVLGELTVRQNILVSLQALRGWSHPLSKDESEAVVAGFIEALQITPADPDLLAKSLSGGNRRKLMLARALATAPRVMILDEPTDGVDAASRVQILARIVRCARDGAAVVFISSELEDVVRLSDRIVVLKDRRKIGELSNGPGVTADTIIEMIAADSRQQD